MHTDMRFTCVEAAAVIALLLHAITIVLIYKKCGKGAVNDLHAHDEEVQQQPNEDDFSNNKRRKSGQEARPKSGQEARPKYDQEIRPNQKNNRNDSDVPSDNYKSDANHGNNDKGMDNRSPNERRTSTQPHPTNDEATRQNENGQPRHHNHRDADHRNKPPPGIDEASGPSAVMQS